MISIWSLTFEVVARSSCTKQLHEACADTTVILGNYQITHNSIQFLASVTSDVISDRLQSKSDRTKSESVELWKTDIRINYSFFEISNYLISPIWTWTSPNETDSEFLDLSEMQFGLKKLAV